MVLFVQSSLISLSQLWRHCIVFVTYCLQSGKSYTFSKNSSYLLQQTCVECKFLNNLSCFTFLNFKVECFFPNFLLKYPARGRRKLQFISFPCLLFSKSSGETQWNKAFHFQATKYNIRIKAYSMCKMKYIITLETSRHLQFILNS